MAKKKRSRTSDFSLGKHTPVGNLPSKEEIDATVAQVSPSDSEPVAKDKRIPFTTALTPANRAALETASYGGRGSVADVLNQALEHYFSAVAPIQNKEMEAVFLKIYRSKQK